MTLYLKWASLRSKAHENAKLRCLRASLPPASIQRLCLTLSLSLSAFPSQSVSLSVHFVSHSPSPAESVSPNGPLQLQVSPTPRYSPFRPPPLLAGSPNPRLLRVAHPLQPLTSRAFTPGSHSRVAPPSSFLASPNRRHR
ncbi:hypothetical protein Fmac_000551 [Flemingia macrophylla]|uniref:Uncharacterized protein n=1 Tax=Flemingia macrophylla TaxID=520843 RepID=A0ABD1NEQ2_9FABA